MTSETGMVSIKGRISHIHGHDQSYISAEQLLDHQEIYCKSID